MKQMNLLHIADTKYLGNSSDGVIGIPAITKDNQIIEISSFFGNLRPKNIIVISSQAGCASRCKFCEMGVEPFIRNLSDEEMFEEVKLMLSEIKSRNINTNKEFKVTFANTGEPLLNPNLLDAIEKISTLNVSFKISTIFPKSNLAKENFKKLAIFANKYKKSVQIQISLISTDEKKRRELAGINILSFAEIKGMAEEWNKLNPEGRKINLSLILTDDNKCNPKTIKQFFPPELFRFRFRRYIPTENGKNNNLFQLNDEEFEKLKTAFKTEGYDAGNWAIPSPTEQKFSLVSTIFRKQYLNRSNSKNKNKLIN